MFERCYFSTGLPTTFTNQSYLKANQEPRRIMKNLSFLLITLICIASSSAARAHGEFKCDVPKAEWKPQMELQRKLTAEGWKVRQVKTDNGCYEVYGFDEKGKRVEIYFNPKTFEKVGEVKQPS